MLTAMTEQFVDDGGGDEGVGADGEMGPMLLDRADRDDEDAIGRLLFELRPRQVTDFYRHRRSPPLLRVDEPTPPSAVFVELLSAVGYR
jgi:hypothetical protein